jgi:hypothetical protein
MQSGTIGILAAETNVAASQDLASTPAVAGWNSELGPVHPEFLEPSGEETLHRLELSSFRNWGINE